MSKIQRMRSTRYPYNKKNKAPPPKTPIQIAMFCFFPINCKKMSPVIECLMGLYSVIYVNLTSSY